jgi:hypothetical protein
VQQQLYAGGMKLKMPDGLVIEVPDAVILRAAGAIYAARRKTHGHPPLHVFHCRWCKGEVRGRIPLEAHERDCVARPSGDLVEVTGDDLVTWTPPEAL